uniref:MADF domain-containing protein n=1 Tax=Anopheles dirus TaxID=7168 RepID=A0A182N2V2_9DIPT
MSVLMGHKLSSIKSMKLFVCLIGVTSFLLLIFCLYTTISTPEKEVAPLSLPNEGYQNVVSYELRRSQTIVPEKYNEHQVKARIIRDKIKRLVGNSNPHTATVPPSEHRNRTFPLNRNVQIFYHGTVAWYKTRPTHPSSDRLIARIYENNSVSFKPNDEPVINTAFYPKRKLYNTSESIVREHFNEIQNCGIGTVVLGWQPNFSEYLLRTIFKVADLYDLKVAIEILEYADRTIESIRSNIKFFVDAFGKGPAGTSSTLSYYNVLSKKRELPLFYIRKAYRSTDPEWKRLLSRNGILTIRDASYDAIVLAHITSKDHKSMIRRAGFDGFYTYLPSNGANYAATWKNWNQLKKFADSYRLLFVPTIGPGFYDRRKYHRNVNQNHGITNIKRYRSNGQYFDVGWRTSLKNNLQIVTINSYNNWVDGTQIEAAIPVFGFRDYLPGPPEKYLDLTQAWVEEYIKYKLNNIKLNKKTELTLNCYDFINSTILLYNVKNVNYRRKNDKDRLWQQIAYELNCSVEVCKRRWKSLRDKFIKLSRVEQSSRGTSDEEQPKKWRYFDSLTFLQGYNKSSLSTTNFLDNIYLGEDRYVDIKCEHPIARQFVRDEAPVTVAIECGSGIGSTERFTVSEAVRNGVTVTHELPSGTGSSGSRKRHLDLLESECVKIIRTAAEAIQMEANCNMRRTSTQLLFEALAQRIDEANLPASRLNALQTAVTNLVYSSL